MGPKTITFPNGFRLIYEKSTISLPITSIYAFCKIGSVYESDGLRGASHIIEHMCFKGTKRIPQTKDIWSEYDKIGAYLNAFTEKNYTCFTIKCDSKYVQNSIEIVSDMMLHSKFTRSNYLSELPIVVEENNNNNNNQDHLTMVDMNRLMFQGTAYEYPIDELAYHTKGTLQYSDVVALYHKHYRPENIILSVVSDLPMEHFKRFLERSAFTKNIHLLPLSEQLPCPIYAKRAEPGVQYNLREKKGITNAIITIGFRTCPRSSPEKYILELLNAVLSQSSGRLFGILRVKKSLVYNFSIEPEYNELGGKFAFFSKTDTNKLMKLVSLFVDILHGLIRNGITEGEFNMAKGYVKGKILLELENQLAQVQYNGEEVLFGNENIVPYGEIYEQFYKNITRDDVNAVIKKYFKPENMCVCLVSEKLPSLEQVKKEFARII
jgi:hypothetical protein